MNKEELLNIMQSDFKLWERAVEEEVSEGVITKTLNLPYGIGEYSLTFEGMNDAGARRNAVGIFGECVRKEIENKIDDDSVTARAAQKAARVGQDSSRVLGEVRDDSEGGQKEDVAAANGAPAVVESGSADFATILSGLRRGIAEYERQLTVWRREAKALEAALEIMNASEDTGKAETNKPDSNEPGSGIAEEESEGAKD